MRRRSFCIWVLPTGVNYGPGLHFAIPFVDKVHKANVKKVHQLEFGFRTMRADVVSQFDESSQQPESLMLTGTSVGGGSVDGFLPDCRLEGVPLQRAGCGVHHPGYFRIEHAGACWGPVLG